MTLKKYIGAYLADLSSSSESAVPEQTLQLG